MTDNQNLVAEAAAILGTEITAGEWGRIWTNLDGTRQARAGMTFAGARELRAYHRQHGISGQNFRSI